MIADIIQGSHTARSRDMNSSGLLGFARVNLTKKPITLLPQLRQGFFEKICIARTSKGFRFSRNIIILMNFEEFAILISATHALI
jgi:hypothetical protein